MLPTLTDRHAVLQVCRDIMRESEVVYLTSLDEDGAPSTRAVFNLRREGQFPALRHLYAVEGDSLLVYITTNTSSEKVRQMRRDARIALYYCIPHTFHGAMLAGRAVEVTDEAAKDGIWQPGWEIYYPGGMHDPDYTIIRLDVARVRGWLGEGGPFDLRLGARA